MVVANEVYRGLHRINAERAKLAKTCDEKFVGLSELRMLTAKMVIYRVRETRMLLISLGELPAAIGTFPEFRTLARHLTALSRLPHNPPPNSCLG